jgi:predicted ester cyclase
MMNQTISGNKQLVTDYLKALSGQTKTPELMARFVSDPYLVSHIQEVEAAFPAYEFIADEIVAERDLVVVRGVFRGVHRATFAGIPATGKSVSAGLMIIYRIGGARIAEHWLQFDLFGLLGQLKETPAKTAA